MKQAQVWKTNISSRPPVSEIKTYKYFYFKSITNYKVFTYLTRWLPQVGWWWTKVPFEFCSQQWNWELWNTFECSFIMAYKFWLPCIPEILEISSNLANSSGNFLMIFLFQVSVYLISYVSTKSASKEFIEKSQMFMRKLKNNKNKLIYFGLIKLTFNKRI